MDNRTLLGITTLLTIALLVTQEPWISITIWFLLLLSVAYSTELSIAVYRVTIWYNVLVISALCTIPQTIFAIRLAQGGLYTAAWIDTLLSTLVDAIFATALVRRGTIGTPYMWSLLPIMVIWSIFAISTNVYTIYPFIPIPIYAAIMLVMGYIVLPIWIVFKHREAWEMPPASAIFVLAFNTIALFIASMNIADKLLELKMAEISVGITATILATLPDLIVAFLIRSAMAVVISDTAGMREAVATMLASAIHDQISVPALLLLLYPEVAPYFPHELALFVVLVKFLLLDKRLYWYIAVPSSLLLFIALS